MNIVLVERFSDESRVCNLGRVSGPGKNIYLFSFSRDYFSRVGHSEDASRLIKGLQLARYDRRGLNIYRFLRIGVLVRVIRALFNRPLSLKAGNLRLLRFCLSNTKGKEKAARLFLDALDLMTFINEHDAEKILCYSVKGFPLIPFISEMLDVPYEEYIERGVQYFGEFAFELLAVVPYAYWLHANDKLEFSISSKDTKCLYYFSQDHEEPCEKRSYVPITEYPAGAMSKYGADVPCFPEILDTSKWIPPPYKTFYLNERFRWNKDLCIICNKYDMEHVSKGEGIAYYLTRKIGIINFLSTDTLCEVVNLLGDRYQIIYNHPLKEDIVVDHRELCDFNDFRILKERFPSVVTMQELLKANRDLSYNQLQLHLFANCERFISVLGGSSYLASYFGGKNIIFAREGWEVQCNAYRNWFDKFSGAEIFHVNNYKDLVDTVKNEFL